MAAAGRRTDRVARARRNRGRSLVRWDDRDLRRRLPGRREPARPVGLRRDEARWEAARRPIVDAVDRDDRFLDIGCASGHLLECLVRSTPHHLDPHGLDLSPRLADLARRRLPLLSRPDPRRQRADVGASSPVRLRPDRARVRPGHARARAHRAPARRGGRVWRQVDPLRLRQPAQRPGSGPRRRKGALARLRARARAAGPRLPGEARSSRSPPSARPEPRPATR